jgi:hypothetical protein
MSAPTTVEDCAMLQQAYLRDLLRSDEMFNNVTVLGEDEGNVESQMDIALGTVTPVSGLAGVCCIVRQPVGNDEQPGVEAAPLSIEWDLMCLEWREMNKDATRGTGKRAWHLARRALRICKGHRAPGLIQCVTIRRPGIVRTSFLKEVMNGVPALLVGYTVRLACNEADIIRTLRTALPVVTGTPALTSGSFYTGSAGASITATCDTPGSTIFYTTNLSNPCSQNATAVQYTVPVIGVAGTVYMFRAFGPTTYLGSNAVAVSIT